MAMEPVAGFSAGIERLSTSNRGVWVGGWSGDLVDKWGYLG